MRSKHCQSSAKCEKSSIQNVLLKSNILKCSLCSQLDFNRLISVSPLISSWHDSGLNAICMVQILYKLANLHV